MKTFFNLKAVAVLLLISSLIPMTAMAGKSKKAKTSRRPSSTVYVVDGLIDRKRLDEEQQIFYSNMNVFCMTIPELRTQKDFNKLIKAMINASPDGNFLPFWTEFGCEPRYIAKTDAPLISLISENSTDRMKYLEMLKVYFESRGDFDSFKKVLNTKNTRGYTTLDYVKYCHDTLRFASVEEKGLNLYVKFLCENGAEYSLYNNATCPVPYMKINY